MAGQAAEEITRLMVAVGDGDEAARERLWGVIYTELRHMARSQMGYERNGHTLQTTALVHEAHLRLMGQNGQWTNRRHFFAAAAEASAQNPRRMRT